MAPSGFGKPTASVTSGLTFPSDDPEPGALDATVLFQLRGDLLDKRRWDREGDADIAEARSEDCGVHANDFALEIEGGAAGTTRVHRCVDLQDVVGT
jgi:hypothetical protein